MPSSGESSYGEILRIMVGEPGGVLSVTGLAGISMLMLLSVGGWLPLMCQLPRMGSQDASAGTPPPRIVEILTLMLGGGIILTVTLGTLSAYLSKSVVPGMVLSGVLGFPLSVRFLAGLRGRILNWGTNRFAFGAVTVFAMGISLWHHAVSEFEYSQGSQRMVGYTDLNGDTSFHVYLATTVRNFGLPLRDLYGSPHREYSQVMHTGHGVLIAGLASVLGVSEFKVSASLWVTAALLLSWSSMAVVMRSKLSGGMVFVCGVIPLVFGPLMLPSVLPFFRPVAALAIDPGIANRMYWNLSQALSTALVAVGLVLFDKYCRRVIGGAGERQMLILVTTTIVVSGWIKPSLFIFYAPALMVTLLLQRARLLNIAVSIGVFAAGTVVYLLPGLLVDVPDVPPWSFHPNRAQTIEVGRFIAFGCGAALLLAISPVIRLVRELFHPQDPRVLTLPLVAMGGSLLFALLFREERFVSFKSFQPNIWWGPSACVLLLLPMLIRHAARQARVKERASVVSITASVLMVIHVINGMQFAMATPAINPRSFPLMKAETMHAAQGKTSPETRFLLDPEIAHVDLAGFLSRPALYTTNYMFPEDREILKDWVQLFEEPKKSAGSGWAAYDAAIVSYDAKRAHEAMQQHGWSGVTLTPRFQLWTRPTTMVNSVDSDK